MEALLTRQMKGSLLWGECQNFEHARQDLVEGAQEPED